MFVKLVAPTAMPERKSSGGFEPLAKACFHSCRSGGLLLTDEEVLQVENALAEIGPLGACRWSLEPAAKAQKSKNQKGKKKVARGTSKPGRRAKAKVEKPMKPGRGQPRTTTASASCPSPPVEIHHASPSPPEATDSLSDMQSDEEIAELSDQLTEQQTAVIASQFRGDIIKDGEKGELDLNKQGVVNSCASCKPLHRKMAFNVIHAQRHLPIWPTLMGWKNFWKDRMLQ